MPAKRTKPKTKTKLTSISMPADLWVHVERRVKESRGKFANVSHYMRFLAEEEMRRAGHLAEFEQPPGPASNKTAVTDESVDHPEKLPKANLGESGGSAQSSVEPPKSSRKSRSR